MGYTSLRLYRHRDKERDKDRNSALIIIVHQVFVGAPASRSSVSGPQVGTTIGSFSGHKSITARDSTLITYIWLRERSQAVREEKVSVSEADFKNDLCLQLHCPGETIPACKYATKYDNKRRNTEASTEY